MTCYLRLHEIAVAVHASAEHRLGRGAFEPGPAADVESGPPRLCEQHPVFSDVFSTIDPLAHFGHTGATNAARFLDELLRWLTTALPRRRDGS